jgi:CBS domain-containing protein
MKAKDVMVAPVMTVSPAMSIDELKGVLTAEGISALPVQSEGGKIIGIVSKTDILQAAALQKSEKFSEIFASVPVVSDIMNYEVVHVSSDASVRSVAEIMIDQHIHQVLVIDDGKVAGIISSFDLLGLVR